MAYWGNIHGVGDPIPIRSFNGLYVADDEGFNLSDNLFTELINFSPDNFPAISTRQGYTVIGMFGSKVLGFGSWKDTELHAVFNDGTWRKWTGSAWVQLASGLSTTAEWSFCNFKGSLSEINLIGSNGVDPIKRYDGTTVQDLAGAPAKGNYITTHSNRLYCAVDNFVRFSALNKPTDWITVNDAGEQPVNTTDGETINGLNAGNGHLTVFKPSSIFELYGKGPQSYSMDLITSDIGATGNKAIDAYDETLPFLSRDGIYRYSGGIRPRKEWSIAVHKMIVDMEKDKLDRCVVANDGQNMYFAIPSNGQKVLQYSVLNNAWYTWDGIEVVQMIRVGENLYFGDTSGRVLKIGGNTDNGAQIVSTAITKPFTAGSMAAKTHWFKIWVVASISSGSTLELYISKHAAKDEWIHAKTLTANSDIQFQELLVPTNTVADANAVRIKIVARGKVTVHEITRQLRTMPMRR